MILKKSLMKFFKLAAPRSAFIRNVSVLALGTAGAQATVVAAAPLLTRLYGPDDFGTFGAFAGILALVAVFSSLRYELAIPIAATDEEASNLAMLSIVIVITAAALIFLGLYFYGMYVANLAGLPQILSYLWMLPIGTIAIGMYNVFHYLAIRSQRYAAVAQASIFQSIATVVIQIFLAKFGGGSLIYGQIVGQSISVISLIFSNPYRLQFRKASFHDLWRSAVRYRHLPFFSTWSALLNVGGAQIPTLLFALYFSPSAAGLYFLVNRVLQLPMSVIGSAIGQVFFGTVAEESRRKNLIPTVTSLYGKLCYIGMPPTLVIIIIGPQLFATVFGGDWAQAGELAQWMAPWFFFGFISSPLSLLFTVMEREAQGLLFQMFLFLSRMVAIYIGLQQDDLFLTIIFLSVANSVVYLGSIFWYFSLLRARFSLLYAPFLKAVSGSVLMVTPLILAVAFDWSYPFIWVYALILSGGIIIARYIMLFR